MIILENLTKVYPTVTAVDHISLTVKKGELFGFLGPNGAGKTTTIRMMAGLVQPTAGSAFIDGWNIVSHANAAKRITGFIPDRPFLYNKLTGREFLWFTGRLYGLKKDVVSRRIVPLLELFHMNDYVDELTESYSHGMKQRLVMAAALIHKPRLLIVDEPMVGLDPKGGRLVKKIFRELCAGGTTVFMSTHTLEIAEEMCDRIGIIQNGRMVAAGTMKSLREKTGAAGKKLEAVFFKLTGGDDVGEVIDALRF